MEKISYLYAKVIDRLRGTAITQSRIHPTSFIGNGCNIVRLTMDKYSYIGHDSQIDTTKIGAFCSISDHVYIGGGEHPLGWLTTSPAFHEKKHGPRKLPRLANHQLDPIKETIIGNDVWIGHAASIKQGIKVGDGAVIAMGAIVTKDVPPYAIVAGAPAKVIRYRFDEETIVALLTSKWWSLSDDMLKELSGKIKDPLAFLELCKNTNTGER